MHFAEGEKKKSVAELEETLAARQKTRYKLPDSGKLITTVFPPRSPRVPDVKRREDVLEAEAAQSCGLCIVEL